MENSHIGNTGKGQAGSIMSNHRKPLQQREVKWCLQGNLYKHRDGRPLPDNLGGLNPKTRRLERVENIPNADAIKAKPCIV